MQKEIEIINKLKEGKASQTDLSGDIDKQLATFPLRYSTFLRKKEAIKKKLRASRRAKMLAFPSFLALASARRVKFARKLFAFAN